MHLGYIYSPTARTADLPLPDAKALFAFKNGFFMYGPLMLFAVVAAVGLAAVALRSIAASEGTLIGRKAALAANPPVSIVSTGMATVSGSRRT